MYVCICNDSCDQPIPFENTGVILYTYVFIPRNTIRVVAVDVRYFSSLDSWNQIMHQKVLFG